MSSSAKESNNRYKSRLLNFFNRQAIQIGDRLGTTFRNVKVATEWGLQIVMYPIYLMVQAGLSVGRQLGQRIDRSALLSGSEDSHSTPEEAIETLTVDRPIEGVLKAIDCASASQTKRDKSPTKWEKQPIDRTYLSVNSQTDKIEILGIASLLENKNLVAIARDNQILDILDSQQQEKLKKSITWEVANYYHDRRLLIESQQQVPDRLLNIDSNNNHVLPPVRLFWQTMDWVQQSPVAMAIDLFDESKLPLRYPHIRDLNLDSSREVELQPKGFLATIDNTIADLETKQFIRGNRINCDREFDLDRNNNLSSDPFQIQALIRAAIDYFFGRQGEKIQLKETIVSEQLVSDRQQQNYLNSRQENLALSGGNSSELERSKSKEDPWLSWEDLFDNSVSTASLPKNPPNTYRDRVRVRGELQLSKRELPSSEGELPFAPTENQDRKKILKLQQFQNNSLIKTEKESTQIITDSLESDDLSTYHYSSADLSNEAQRDIWEVKSTPVGYEKHTLERILELLDRAILLLENLFVFIWRKIKNLF
jgi:hypothetical protein